MVGVLTAKAVTITVAISLGLHSFMLASDLILIARWTRLRLIERFLAVYGTPSTIYPVLILRASDALKERLIWASARLSAALLRVSAAPGTDTVAKQNGNVDKV
eukprot:6188794-Pleurochrysis_carterae.AAC.1